MAAAAQDLILDRLAAGVVGAVLAGLVWDAFAQHWQDRAELAAMARAVQRDAGNEPADDPETRATTSGE